MGKKYAKNRSEITKKWVKITQTYEKDRNKKLMKYIKSEGNSSKIIEPAEKLC